MTEPFNGQDNPTRERECLEAVSVESLVDHVLSQGERIADIERNMRLANEIMESRGTSLEEELKKRETKDETKT